MNKGTKVLAVWVIYLAIMLGLGFGLHRTADFQIPVGNEIERAISVKGLENKFVVMRSMGLGGAGAGGMGAPTVTAYSSKQFVELVPKNENVYVAFQQSDRWTLKKVYWAFIENRAGLMVYEEIYQHDGYNVKGYTQDTVYFHYDNLDKYGWLTTLLVTVGVFGFVASLIITARN